MEGLATIAPDDDRAGSLDQIELLRVAFRATAESPGVARGLTARVLDGSPHLDVVLVLVSELVTNAVLHARGEGELTITRRHHTDATHEIIRVEVRDSDRDAPESPASPGAHGGFGLRIVNALARDWGFSPLADGKVVWFEVGGR